MLFLHFTPKVESEKDVSDATCEYTFQSMESLHPKGKNVSMRDGPSMVYMWLESVSEKRNSA